MMRLAWRSAVLTGLAGIAFAGAAFGGGKAAWFVTGSLIGLAAVGITAGFALRGGIAVKRTLPGRPLSAGDALRVEGTVTLPFRFPLAFVFVVDEWLNVRTGRTAKGAFLLAPMGRKTVPFSYWVTGLDRGVYRLLRTEASVADFFDLAGFRRRMSAPGGAGLSGLRDGSHDERGSGRQPERTEETGAAAGLPEGAEGAPGFVVGPAPAALSEGGTDAARRPDHAAVGGVRLYAEGDPPGRIDWKSSLRAGRLMVKTPDEEDGRTALVLVDPGSAPDDFERALGAAAAFFRMREREAARGGLAERDAVLPGEGFRRLSLLREGLAAILRRLALMERGFAGSAENAEPMPEPEDQVVLATGRLDRSFVEKAIDRARRSPVRVLAAPGGPPGEAERRAAAWLEDAGIEVVFALPDKPRHTGGAAAANPPVKGRRAAI